MPTYEYHCSSCERDLEIFQSMRDEPLTTCPECDISGQITRKISGGAGIIFKGSGFYETDYKRPANPEAKGEDSAANKIDKSSGEASKPKETSSATKSTEATPAKSD